MERINLKDLKREVEKLRKKIFIYETLQAEKEIKEKKIKGPFRSGKDVLKSVK